MVAEILTTSASDNETVLTTSESRSWHVSAGRRVPAAPDDRAALLAVIVRAQAGELDAQSELVRRYHTRISAFVRPYLALPSAVEDIVQMVFIKMVRRIGLLRDARTFESWLFTLARNTALDAIRRARCRPSTISDDAVLLNMASSDNSALMHEIYDALELAVEKLGSKDRALVALIVEGASYRAAAERMGLTIGAVKVRLNRARKILRVSVGAATGLRPAEPMAMKPSCVSRFGGSGARLLLSA